MYGGYAWLTNTRTPVRRAGAAAAAARHGRVPDRRAGHPARVRPGRRRRGAVLGLGYLLVVLVHASLYAGSTATSCGSRPFNITSALLVIAGRVRPTAPPGLRPVGRRPGHPGAGSPLVVSPGGRFEIQPAHFVERHGALIIVALGESVAASASAPSRAGRDGLSWSPRPCSGLALSAAPVVGVLRQRRRRAGRTGDDRGGPGTRRPGLALYAYFYAHIPMLLGIVSMAAGRGPGDRPRGPAASPAGRRSRCPAAWRRSWPGRRVPGRAGIGSPWAAAGHRRVRAGRRSALGATVAVEAQLAVLLAALVLMLAG